MKLQKMLTLLCIVLCALLLKDLSFNFCNITVLNQCGYIVLLDEMFQQK